MIRRFTKDESGMTMGLVVIMIALIGAMGAGLLVFVNTDLTAVAEANRGQRAFEMADTGAKAAKRQLINNPDPQSYDGSNTPTTDSQWAFSPSVAGGGGKNLTMDGDGVNVQIESDTPSANLFTVIATGCAPADCSSARRKVEVVFSISALGTPSAFFSRHNIIVSGAADLEGASVFSLRDVCVSDKVSFGTVQDLYKTWAAPGYPNPFNVTARDFNTTGIGAVGEIKSVGGGGKKDDECAEKKGKGFEPVSGRDFDSTTKPKTFVQTPSNPQNSDEITFPFDISLEQDAINIESLRQYAIRREQETGYNYYRDAVSGKIKVDHIDTIGSGSDNKGWPPNATQDTVVFYDFADYDDKNSIEWSIKDICPKDKKAAEDAEAQGILVINNGNFSIEGSSDFTGAVIIRSDVSGPDKGTFRSRGTSCIAGFVNASGNIDMGGTADIEYRPNLQEIDAFKQFEMRSWRELYN